MGNALAVAGLTNLPSVDVNFGDYSTDFDFVPRIQLVTKGKYVDLGKIDPGHYGVPQGEDEILDLGEAIDVLPLAVRNKALDTNSDPPVAVYDVNDPLYVEIKERAAEKDSGCMFGPSFLVFEPTTGNFYELFLGNKSGRQESGKLAPYLPVSKEQAKKFGVEAKGPTPATLQVKYIQRPRYSWHVPVVTKCSTPITNLPDGEIVAEQVAKFLEAKSDGAGEPVKETTKGKRRSR